MELQSLLKSQNFKIGLALIVFPLISVITLLLFFKDIPADNKTAIMLLLGNVMGWGGSIVNYEFGSSKGSDRKTEMLANSAPLPTSSVSKTETVSETAKPEEKQ